MQISQNVAQSDLDQDQTSTQAAPMALCCRLWMQKQPLYHADLARHPMKSSLSKHVSSAGVLHDQYPKAQGKKTPGLIVCEN